MRSIHRNFTGTKNAPGLSRNSNRQRHLLFEPLEERQLLAVSPYSLFTDQACTKPGLAGSYVNTSLWHYSAQDDWRQTQAIAGTRVDDPPTFLDNSWGKRSEVHLTNGTDENWDHFSVQWDGYVKVDQPTVIATWSDDGSRMWIDVNQDGVFDASGNEFLNNGWGYVHEPWVGEKSTTLNTGVYKIRIQYYEWDGGNVFAIRDFPAESLGYSGVAVDSEDNVINTESVGNRVTVYDSSGQIKFYFGSAGSGNGQFNAPRDVTVDKNDNIYVADSGNNRIQVFDSTGKFLRSFGGLGTAAGKFNNPEGIRYDAKTDRLYVADTGNHRVQCFTTSGQPVTAFGNGGVIGTTGTLKRDHTGFDRPTDVAVHPITGNVYIADKINSRIVVYDALGKYVRTYHAVYQPEALAFQSNGDLLIAGDDDMKGGGYVNQAFEGRIRVLRNDGELTSLNYFGGIDDIGKKTSGVAVRGNGTILFSDEYNNRIAATKTVLTGHAFPDDLAFVEPITDLEIDTYGTEVIIRWKTATPSASDLRWGTDKNNPTGSVSDARLKTSHELKITGLTPQSLLYYQVGFGDSFTPGKVRWTPSDKINSGVPMGEKLVLRLKAVGVICTDKNPGIGFTPASEEEIAKMQELYRQTAAFIWQNTGFNVWIDFVAMPIYAGDCVWEDLYLNPLWDVNILSELGFEPEDEIDLFMGMDISGDGWGGGRGGLKYSQGRYMGWTCFGYNNGGIAIHELNHVLDFMYGWNDLPKYENVHAIWSIKDAVGGSFAANAQAYGNLYNANYTATGGDFNKWIVVPDADHDGLPDDSPTGQGLVNPLPITEKTLGSSPLKIDTDGDGVSDFDEARFFPWGGIDPTKKDTDGDGIDDGLDLNPGYPIGDHVKKGTPKLDGVIGANENWTIVTDHWSYDNEYGVWDNNEQAQTTRTAMAWDDQYLYVALEYGSGWDWVSFIIDGGCDNWYWGSAAYEIGLHPWLDSPDIGVITSIQDMQMMIAAEYGDFFRDNDARFTNPYNGRPIADNQGDGLGFEKPLIDRSDIKFVKKYDDQTKLHTWELAIPWSPNVTGLVGYDQKTVGIDVTVLGDKLFNTETYAKIKFVNPDASKLTVAADKQSIDEGIADGVTFTVTRTGDNSQSLELTVTSSDTTELTVPQTVTIPAGQNSVTFTGSSVKDDIVDGDIVVQVTVSAQGFDSVTTSVTVADIDVEQKSEAVTFPETGTVSQWTLRKNGEKLEIVGSDQKPFWSREIARLKEIEINSSTSRNDSLTIDFSFGGAFTLSDGVQFKGNATRDNILYLVGTDEDDTVQFNALTGMFNELAIRLQNVDAVRFDGSGGEDSIELTGYSKNDTFHFRQGDVDYETSLITYYATNTEAILACAAANAGNADILSTGHGNMFSMSDNSFVMTGGGYRLVLRNFNVIEAIAAGRNGKTHVYGENGSLIVMNDTFVERRGQDQFYRIWHSERVTAINLDDPDSAILHTGSRAYDDYTMTTGYGVATNAIGSYLHEFVDFDNVIISNPMIAPTVSFPTASGWTQQTDRGVWTQNGFNVTVMGHADVVTRDGSILPLMAEPFAEISVIEQHTISLIEQNLAALAATPVGRTSEAFAQDDLHDNLYAILADAQVRSQCKTNKWRGQDEDWLAGFEKLALLELRK